MVKAGLLGRKSGKGFYLYGKGKSKSKQLNPEVATLLKPFVRSDAGASFTTETIVERMVLRYMNEAFFCLQVRVDVMAGCAGRDVFRWLTCAMCLHGTATRTASSLALWTATSAPCSAWASRRSWVARSATATASARRTSWTR